MSRLVAMLDNSTADFFWGRNFPVGILTVKMRQIRLLVRPD